MTFIAQLKQQPLGFYIKLLFCFIIAFLVLMPSSDADDARKVLFHHNFSRIGVAIALGYFVLRLLSLLLQWLKIKHFDTFRLIPSGLMLSISLINYLQIYVLKLQIDDILAAQALHYVAQCHEQQSCFAALPQQLRFNEHGMQFDVLTRVSDTRFTLYIHLGLDTSYEVEASMAQGVTRRGYYDFSG